MARAVEHREPDAQRQEPLEGETHTTFSTKIPTERKFRDKTLASPARW